MGEKTEKRLLIEKMQQELKVENLKNKCRQFEIRILELEEEIERIAHNRLLCEEEIEKILKSEQ
jgi:hypothetical protein